MSGIWLVAFVLQWVVLLLLTALLAGVLRYMNTFRERVAQTVPHVTRFEVGERIDAFTLPDLNGRLVASKDLLGQNKRVMLLMMSTTCDSCRALIAQVDELARRDGGLRSLGWSFVLSWYGEPSVTAQLVKNLLLSDDLVVLIDEEADLPRGFLTASLPIGMALDNHGRVLDQSANPGPNWFYRVIDAAAPEYSRVPASWMTEIETAG